MDTITQNYIRIHDIQSIKTLRNLEAYISDFKDEMTDYEWLLVSKSSAFNLSIAELFPAYLNWEHICTFQMLPIAFMNKYAEYLNWYSVARFQPLTYKFIIDHKDSLSMDRVIDNPLVRNLKEYDEIQKLHKTMKKQKKFKMVWDANLQESMFFATAADKDFSISTATKEVVFSEEEIKKLKKDDLKEILNERDIQFTYKDKIALLKTKLLNHQKLNKDFFTIEILETMKKSEFRQILEKRSVRVYYHDTIVVLKQKILDTQ